MRIGIDARLIGETGVGRYIRNLIGEVAKQDDTNEYVIFLPTKQFAGFSLPNVRWSKVLVDIHWHTVEEQIKMPGIFRAAKLDLIHIPYHNPPILYGGRMVVTIHDLTILHFATGKATTLPWPLYVLKRLGYWLELWIGLRRAEMVIAVSETTKREIIDHIHIPAEKIAVTYEGVDPLITGDRTKLAKRLLPDPYFLYVGNAYPHKNVEMLVESFKRFLGTVKSTEKPKLVLVGGSDFFYMRVKKSVESSGISESVIFFGAANDSELISLYTNAVAFVFPSRMEGFGLPALEALSLGCRVCVSDIPIFHEILGDRALYFDPLDPSGIAEVLKRVWHQGNPEHAAEPGKPKLLQRYSWSKMARETLTIYERSARI